MALMTTSARSGNSRAEWTLHQTLNYTKQPLEKVTTSWKLVSVPDQISELIASNGR